MTWFSLGTWHHHTHLLVLLLTFTTLLTELENSHIRHAFMSMFVIYLYFHVVGVQPSFFVRSALLIFLVSLFVLLCMSSFCFLLILDAQMYINSAFWIKCPQKMKILNYKEVLQRPWYRYICTECVFVYRYTLRVTISTYASITEDIYLYSVFK